MDPINTPTYLRLREQIRADIIAGVWALGSHVTLIEMSSHYGVSANPVREALLQLQGEGIIDMRMHRGALIPSVDERYIDNIYKLRGALQVMLAREAAVRATPEQVEQLQALRETHETAVAGNDVAACVRANRALHHHMDSLADNPPALDVLASRSCLVDAFRRARGYGAGRLDAVVAQHRKLVRAIARGDADKAGQAAFEHTEASRRDLLAALKAGAAP
jgi:DNA-binding GntR family transcriptional regulator